MRRPPLAVFRAFFQAPFYVAFFNIFRLFDQSPSVLWRYVTGIGDYPYRCRIKTPAGQQAVTCYSADDLVTTIESFAKIDYPGRSHYRTYVDLGSNVGISALYFLTRSSDSFAYLYEPVEKNIERLKLTLHGFEDRYDLHPVAVGLMTGQARFGIEPTGRYGGLDKPDLEESILVDVLPVNDELERIIDVRGKIDLLKIDVEGMEGEILRNLTDKILRNTAVICAETFGFEGDLPGFNKQQYGAITRFYRQ